MSFMQKFNQNSGTSQGTPTPNGINLAYTSFGVQSQQGTYNPTFQSQTQVKTDSSANHRKGRPGGGWDDDEDNTQSTLKTGTTFTKPTFTSNNTSASTTMGINSSFSKSASNGGANSSINGSKSAQKSSDLDLIAVDETFLQTREYEHKLVLDTIQPGGARLKQTDTVLNTFLKAAETLNAAVVSSIIISKLRAIYDIETLVKKLPKYFEFFKYNLASLKGLDFSLTDSNANNISQLDTILRTVVKYIEDPQTAVKPTVQNQPYTPNIKNEEVPNLLEFEESQNGTQKKSNAFTFLNSTTQAKPTTETQAEKKPSAFGFVGSNSGMEQAPPKKDAFNFIKGGGGGNQAPNNGNSFGNSSNANPTSNIMNLYASNGNQQSNGFGGLNSINFTMGTQVQPQQVPQQGAFGNGYNQYGGGYYNQGTGGSYNNYNRGTNLEDLASNYQGLENQLTNLNLGYDINAENDKKKKEQQAQEEKFFDFVKF